MAYSTGPYARYTTLPVLPRPEIHSARSINYEHLRYEITDATGGFDGMPPIVQQVILLIQFNVEEPKFVSDQTMTKVQKDIRTALSPLTKPPNPQITLKEVTVERKTIGGMTRTVVFNDLTRGTGTDITVQLT